VTRRRYSISLWPELGLEGLSAELGSGIANPTWSLGSGI